MSRFPPVLVQAALDVVPGDGEGGEADVGDVEVKVPKHGWTPTKIIHGIASVTSSLGPHVFHLFILV